MERIAFLVDKDGRLPNQLHTWAFTIQVESSRRMAALFHIYLGAKNAWRDNICVTLCGFFNAVILPSAAATIHVEQEERLKFCVARE